MTPYFIQQSLSLKSTYRPAGRIAPVVVSLLVGVLLLAGCGGQAADLAGVPSSAEPQRAAEAEMAEEPMTVLAGRYQDGQSVPLEQFLANAVQAQEQRVIIYTGTMSLVVRDTREAVEAIGQLAEGQGGYVAGSNIFESEGVPRGSVTIRVPADRYQPVLAQLRALALRVERERSSTEDITEEFVDLQARKQNLEVTESALQELLNERQRMGSTSDILDVHRELTDIRGQIEQIEGRLRYLANQAALSTIEIELIPDVLYQPISVGGWEPQGVARQALQALIGALQFLANVLIWLVIFVLPIVVVLLIPLLLIGGLVRWVWRRRRSRAAPPPEQPSPPPPAETE